MHRSHSVRIATIILVLAPLGIRSLLPILSITASTQEIGSSPGLEHLQPGNQEVIDEAPTTLEEYWYLVETTHDLLTHSQDISEDAVRRQLQGLVLEWEVISIISLPDGTLVPIDNSYLLNHMRDENADLTRLGNLLGTLLESRDNLTEKDTSYEDFLALSEILSRSEFQWQAQEPSPLQIWLAELYRRLLNFLSRLFGSIPSIARIPGARIFFLTLGLLTVLFVLIYAFRGFRSSFASEIDIDLEESFGEARLTARSAMEKANHFSTHGDYRQAVRYLYLSSLLSLDEQDRLRYDPAKTNREYLRDLVGAPGLSRLFGEVVEVFDQVWYGYQPLDALAFENYSRQVTKLMGE